MEIGLPVLFAVILWWFSTGAILFLDGLRRETYVLSMAAATAAAAGALIVLWWTRDSATSAGAYAAFTAAIVVWGWNEMAFLMGFVTGPRRIPASQGGAGWTRFREASATIISHEVAIALSALVIAVMVWDSGNMLGLWTFVVLWLMRLSAKLNIFLGAPNVADEFLPPHLAYLSSYFRRRPMNGLFPIAITAATLVTAWLAHKALWAASGSHDAVGYALLAALMALAVIEHWLLFIPIETTWLWRWSLRGRRAADLHSPATIPPAGLTGRR